MADKKQRNSVDKYAATFGTSKVHFDMERLIELLKKMDRQSVKTYLAKHFIRTMDGAFQWDPVETKAVFYESASIRGLFGALTLIENVPKANGEGCDVIKTKVADLVLCNPIIVNMTSTNKQPRTFVQKGGHYLNLFTPPMHYDKPLKPLTDFQKGTQSAVKRIWWHVENVLCNGIAEQFEFAKRWIIYTIHGVKLGSFMYLYGKQGLGKSFLFEYIQKYVLGKNSVLATQNFHLLLPGAFNELMEGKYFMVLEELGDADKNRLTSDQLHNSVKDFVTNETMQINQKYMKMRMVENITNLVINTNNPNGYKVQDGARRDFVLDCSDKYASGKPGATEYWSSLHDAIDNEEVGFAFLCHCTEMYDAYVKADPKWKGLNPPQSEAKIERLQVHLPRWIKFLKDEYVLSDKDLNCKRSALYSEYEAYCKKKNAGNAEGDTTFFSNQYIGSLIYDRETGNADGLKLIEKYKKNVMWLSASKKAMFDFFKAKHWIGADDIPEPRLLINGDLNLDYEDAKELIQSLQAEITELKQKLAASEAAAPKTKPVEEESTPPTELACYVITEDDDDEEVPPPKTKKVAPKKAASKPAKRTYKNKDLSLDDE